MAQAGYRALDALMFDAEAGAPEDVPLLAAKAASRMGLAEATIYLADVQQDRLVPLPGAQPEPPALPIDGTLAGWCYRTSSVQTTEAEPTGLRVWIPMLDGVERVGVLGLRGDRLDAPRLRFCRSLATLLTMIVLTKGSHSDNYTRLQRSAPMRLSAELLWAFLPPRTLNARDVLCTAALEPAYEMGGDSFDHALVGSRMHATVLDAMGHDLRAGLTSAVALAGGRNARRSGLGLGELAESVDEILAAEFPTRYCTGVFVQLDLPTGELEWVNCGHPVPLLIRGLRLVPGAFDRAPELPLGFGALTGQRRAVHRLSLRPGDRVLLYTDGVTDARSSSGERFGLKNFTEFIIRATAAGEPAYETLRRLIHALLAHHDDRLTDDATIVLFEWRPERGAQTS
ncbi:serine/threonine protein phosphatase [Streptomyces hoynatensis]|uniref:Serine/threonine protein phosphatase n=2 Tax=Streptomyces hoynatensis TaxID=1141874 RepID=A0A3A9YVR7_9ACTN|nr:serine/threonine protein phosphatase [Streptomyces hoynatensis]